MALFEEAHTNTKKNINNGIDDDNDDHAISQFPTLPAFTVRVELRTTPQYGPGHQGVFALQRIPKGTKFWLWTDRVEVIPHNELEDYISTHVVARDIDDNCDNDDSDNKIKTFLRQGFVLPPSKNDEDGTYGTEDQFFYSNPTDGGRFMNHANHGVANCGPDGAIRDIFVGEELMMDYTFHGNPKWYQDICQKYGVLTEAQVAAAAAAAAAATVPTIQLKQS